MKPLFIDKVTIPARIVPRERTIRASGCGSGNGEVPATPTVVGIIFSTSLVVFIGLER